MDKFWFMCNHHEIQQEILIGNMIFMEYMVDISGYPKMVVCIYLSIVGCTDIYIYTHMYIHIWWCKEIQTTNEGFQQPIYGTQWGILWNIMEMYLKVLEIIIGNVIGICNQFTWTSLKEVPPHQFCGNHFDNSIEAVWHTWKIVPPTAKNRNHTVFRSHIMLV